ncbi:MAG: hypothetical protein LBD91_05545 [Prevotellaceae bacterium]|jgi:hypothetical protein|nr:hypothetical protein [Prevotellaceae bacterium]
MYNINRFSASFGSIYKVGNFIPASSDIAVYYLPAFSTSINTKYFPLENIFLRLRLVAVLRNPSLKNFCYSKKKEKTSSDVSAMRRICKKIFGTLPLRGGNANDALGQFHNMAEIKKIVWNVSASLRKRKKQSGTFPPRCGNENNIPALIYIL